MKIAFIIDPVSQLKAYKDSSVAMMREAAARGHTLHVLRQEDMLLHDQQVLALAKPLHLLHDAEHWYSLGTVEKIALHQFDAVIMRKDPPFDTEYLYSTHLLELATVQGARVFNRPSALRDFNEKLAIARFPQFTAPTLVSCRAEVIKAFLHEHGDIILKPLDAMGGSEIFRVRSGEVNLNVIIETLTRLGRRTIMAQRYIPEISAGDKRILLIDGVPVPYALARIPAEGETRGNLAAGGRGVAQPLSARDLEIATTIGAVLRELGLFLVGLDVIGDYLTEINVTSPTGFVEISLQTDCNVAALFIDALEQRCR
ncbi:glutathione synthase [Sulfuriferula thiophila]|uniref:glutathione synthase n=1 Tax=Sulfuriferula thiophila TaxID=1781211 RepID=UPI000F60CFC9|nr:glutathione synthase [Sulfuriferula thiophila]